MARLTRTPSLSSDSNSGKLNLKNYPFYNDSVLNATIPLWFIDCSREDAEKLLKTKYPCLNVVLMRPSTKAGCMALSVQTIIAGNTDVNHYSVVKSTKGFIIDIDKEHRPMKTLSEVIDQFVKMASTSRKYVLFGGKSITSRMARSVTDGPSNRVDKPDPHKRLPLPPTPGAPQTAPRRSPDKKPSAFSAPKNDASDGYVAILKDVDDVGYDQRTTTDREDYLIVCEGDESCDTQAIADTRDYLTVFENPPDADSTPQLQGLRIDDQEHYLIVTQDVETDVNDASNKHLNNNNTAVQPAPKPAPRQGPPPTAPRPAARS